MKTYTTHATRDAATAILRKAGVPKTEYNRYIEKRDDGTYRLDRTLLAQDLSHHAAVAHVDQEAAKPAKPAKPAKEPKAKPATKERATSTAARIRALILAGKTNDEIRTELELPEYMRTYPSWYRAELKRNRLASA